MKTLINISLFIFLSQICTAQVMMLFSSDSLANITSPADLDYVGVTDSLGGAIATDEGVHRWRDLSGNGRDIGLGNFSGSPTRPIYKATGGPGSKPCIVFSSSIGLDQLEEIDSSYWSSDEFTAIAVWKVANETTNFDEFPVMTYGKSGSDLECWRVFTSNTENGYKYQFVTAADGSALISDRWDFPKSTVFRVDSWVVSTTTNTSTFFSDGSEKSLDVNNTQTGIYNNYIEAWIGRRPQSISEIIVYSRALTTTERTAIENYLNKKYDLY